MTGKGIHSSCLDEALFHICNAFQICNDIVAWMKPDDVMMWRDISMMLTSFRWSHIPQSGLKCGFERLNRKDFSRVDSVMPYSAPSLHSLFAPKTVAHAGMVAPHAVAGGWPHRRAIDQPEWHAHEVREGSGYRARAGFASHESMNGCRGQTTPYISLGESIFP